MTSSMLVFCISNSLCYNGFVLLEKMIGKLFKILNKKQKQSFALLVLACIVGSAFELLGISTILPLTIVVTNESILEANSILVKIGDVFGLYDVNGYVVFFSVFLLISYIIKNSYLCFLYFITYKYVYGNQQKMSSSMLMYYLSQDYQFFTKTNVSILQRNIINDVNFCFDGILNLIYILNESFVCVSIIIYLFILDSLSTIVVSVALLFMLSLFVLFFKKYSMKVGELARESSSEQVKWLLQSFGGIKEIKVMNRSEYFFNKYDCESKKYSFFHRKQSFASSLPKPVMETMCICGLLLIVIVKVLNGDDPKNLVPILSAFAVSAFRIIPSINKISGCYSSLMFDKASIDSVYNCICDSDNLIYKVKNTNKNCHYDLTKDVVFHDVCFKYEGSNDYIVKGLSFIIPPLKSVAIIGPSGSGKTTLVDLLLGILLPTQGKITIDNININDNIEMWHKSIGYIPQNIYLLDDTIRANVAFGVPNDEIDDDKVWESLKEAHLDEFVLSLPDNIYSFVGDRGSRISGGQRQRIGIARALYFSPKILVFDEATSSLDNETEKAVMSSINSLKGTRTMIIVAHRLTTIKNCDYIYEVKNKGIKLINNAS